MLFSTTGKGDSAASKASEQGIAANAIQRGKLQPVIFS
jgi:hypothetical protein